jgi:hypothetical protein
MNSEELGKKLGQMIAKALADDAFKQKLLSDTVAALKEEGVELPVGLELRVVQNTENLLFIGLLTSSSRALSEEELGDVAGGEPAHPIERLISRPSTQKLMK